MIVMFDVDGVLANFGKGYDALCRKLNKQPPGPDAPWDAKWDDDVWREIKTSHTWWTELPAIPDSNAFFRIAILKGEIYFVTARPGIDVKRQTERWLMCRGIENPTVILSGKKGEIAAALGVDFSIEDKAGNAVYISYQSPATMSYLVDRPYNQFNPDMLGRKVVRIKEVEEFLTAIEQEAA